MSKNVFYFRILFHFFHLSVFLAFISVLIKCFVISNLKPANKHLCHKSVTFPFKLSFSQKSFGSKLGQTGLWEKAEAVVTAVPDKRLESLKEKWQNNRIQLQFLVQKLSHLLSKKEKLCWTLLRRKAGKVGHTSVHKNRHQSSNNLWT